MVNITVIKWLKDMINFFSPAISQGREGWYLCSLNSLSFQFSVLVVSSNSTSLRSLRDSVDE
jgi:hypothetical protein